MKVVGTGRANDDVAEGGKRRDGGAECLRTCGGERDKRRALTELTTNDHEAAEGGYRSAVAAFARPTGVSHVHGARVPTTHLRT